MTKFLKDQKIDILALDLKTEDYYPVKAGAWAYVRHMSATEQFNAGISENGKVNMLFIINKPNFTIINIDKIKYKGIEYDIHQIDDYDGRTTELKIYATGDYLSPRNRVLPKT